MGSKPSITMTDRETHWFFGSVTLCNSAFWWSESGCVWECPKGYVLPEGSGLSITMLSCHFVMSEIPKINIMPFEFMVFLTKFLLKPQIEEECVSFFIDVYTSKHTLLITGVADRDINCRYEAPLDHIVLLLLLLSYIFFVPVNLLLFFFGNSKTLMLQHRAAWWCGS